MQHRPPTDFFAPKLALFFAALFFAMGLQMPVFPLWLAAKGLDAGAIGVVLAAPALMRIAAIPIATAQADRFGALAAAIAVGSVCALIGTAGLGFAEGVLWIAALYVLASA